MTPSFIHWQVLPECFLELHTVRAWYTRGSLQPQQPFCGQCWFLECKLFYQNASNRPNSDLLTFIPPFVQLIFQECFLLGSSISLTVQKKAWLLKVPKLLCPWSSITHSNLHLLKPHIPKTVTTTSFIESVSMTEYTSSERDASVCLF